MKNLFLTLLLASILTPALNGQCVECPQCGTEAAIGFLEETTNKKTVYKVSQKEIAVPNVCLPCSKFFNLREQLAKLRGTPCCPGKPCGCEKGDCPKQVREGTIKVVKVLEKSSVKCKACAYQWKVADIEDVNKYLYDYDPEAEKKAEKKAETVVEPKAPAKKDESAPIQIKDQPELDLEVPAAPKMGWRDRPLFQPTISALPASTSSSSRSYLISKPGPSH